MCENASTHADHPMHEWRGVQGCALDTFAPRRLLHGSQVGQKGMRVRGGSRGALTTPAQGMSSSPNGCVAGEPVILHRAAASTRASAGTQWPARRDKADAAPLVSAESLPSKCTGRKREGPMSNRRLCLEGSRSVSHLDETSLDHLLAPRVNATHQRHPGRRQKDTAVVVVICPKQPP
jgi:hypothetical protein